MQPSKGGTAHHKGRLKSMAESNAKRAWMQENTICVNLRINRNQDPELFELLTKADNKSAVIRDLLNQALPKK
jgi:hypothetical protein